MSRIVLLTGSNGLLGSKLIPLLANRSDVQLVAISRGGNRYPNTDGFIYESADITNFAEMRNLFERYRFTDVVNTAAMTNVDACEKDSADCQAINVDAVGELCALCKEFDARLIHLSTDFIFDGKNGPYKEEDAPAPLSIYGQAKYDAEKLIQAAGIRWAILRTVLIYGTAPDLSRSNIVLWAKASLEKGQTIRVVDDQFRTPTLAEDLADGVAAVLLQNQTGIYHLSGDEMFCIIDLVRAVARFWGLDESLISSTDSISLNQPAVRPPKTGFIIEKARKDLGYSPHTFTEGLALLDKQLKEAALITAV